MDIFIYLFIFLIGSVFGSFLNVIVDRDVSGKSYIKGRSKCDHCGKPLSSIELIPVVSFIMQQGRCINCKKRLSFYYPVTEIVTGILFVICVFQASGGTPVSSLSGSSIIYVFYLLYLVSVLIVVFFTDLKYGIIPFYLTVLTIVVVAAYYFFVYSSSDLTMIHNYFFSAIGAFLLFLIIFLATKGRGMGFGDVIYVFLMGLILGYPNIILGLYIAFLSGAAISLILIFLKRKKMKGGTIPFGPFLVLGTVISLFWGNFIIDKLLHFLLQ